MVLRVRSGRLDKHVFSTLGSPGTKFLRERFAEQVAEIRGSAQSEQEGAGQGTGEGADGQTNPQGEEGAAAAA